MPHVSPTLEGFRAAFRRPSLTFAEIAWRWVVGASTVALFVFYCVEYLDTLPVSNGDALLLSTRQPALVGQAIQHILRGSLSRAIFAALIVGLALSILWIVASSFGRLATVRGLLDYFRRDKPADGAIASEYDLQNSSRPRPIRALTDLNFLRVAVVLATVLALGGAGILAGFASSRANPRPGLAFILFLPLSIFVLVAAWALNWWLSLAAVFVVRDGETALGALSAAVTCFRERTGAVSAVSTWTGFAHLVAFSIAGTASSFPLAFVQIAPPRLVIVGIILVTLAYFAVADWLYIARLAGYVCITEWPQELAEASPDPVFLSPQEKLTPLGGTVDREEKILSDVPDLAVEQ